MKRFFLGATVVVLVLGLGWLSRGYWRDRIEEARKPELPRAIVYAPVGKAGGKPPASLPPSVNLAVPFLSQAPKQNWAMPYQEACEEAALIMVDAYFAGRTSRFAAEEGDQAILDLVKFEGQLGLLPDISAIEGRDLISKYFAKRKARVIVRPTMDEVRGLLAGGVPVVVPADGKALKNPNFRNGGPPYHMLVLKGYLADGRWISNDPGTRKGADYVYDKDVLWNAVRDWNGGNVKTAVPSVIVMEAVK